MVVGRVGIHPCRGGVGYPYSQGKAPFAALGGHLGAAAAPPDVREELLAVRARHRLHRPQQEVQLRLPEVRLGAGAPRGGYVKQWGLGGGMADSVGRIRDNQ